MGDELQRILKMVEEGKLSSEQAAEFVRAMNNGTEEVVASQPIFEKRNTDQKMIRIYVKSEEKDDVKVQIPLKFVKSLKGMIQTIPQVKEHAGDIDFDTLFESIENGLEGPLVDIKTENETVLITIE